MTRTGSEPLQPKGVLDRLIKHVEGLAQMLAKLPRSTKDELNKITTGLNWRQFDPEVFAEFMHAILDALAARPHRNSHHYQA
jgi:hypothetical protein